MHRKPTLIAFARANWKLVSILLLATLIAVWFSARLFLQFLYFNDPRHIDQDLRGWMTPHYVSLSYDLPRDVVREVLDLSEDQRGRRTLDDIAAEMGISLEDLTDRVRAAAEAHRAGDTP